MAVPSADVAALPESSELRGFAVCASGHVLEL
jgi:hypothetical protein